MKHNINNQSYNIAGLFSLSIRLVIGWTYFSAFWRRLVLADKLDMESAGYIGEKFNHFLPNALGIGPLIEYLVLHPDILWWAMVIFTMVEGIVGLMVMLGFFSRLMGIGVFSLALGILLGSGWLGTTCLDEWQIGVLGVASGFFLFLSGSSSFSIDQWLLNKKQKITQNRWFVWLGSGVLPIRNLKTPVFLGALIIFGLTLYTNQYFHGGLWGTLHNKSVKPHIEISNATLQNYSLQFDIFRTEGVDVYGSFLIGIQLTDHAGQVLLQIDGEELSQLSLHHIKNYYVAKVKPGKHSLIVPLGAKAQLNFKLSPVHGKQNAPYVLTLTDISGAEWHSNVWIE